jgi:hypothetical protein
MLDERPIFKGEIQKAPGMLLGAEEVAENILFCTDEEVLCAIEDHDLHDVNVNPTREPGTPPERLKTAGERPKTAGRRNGSADSQRTGSGSSHSNDWSDDAGAASWSYLSRDKDINGPTERLPPDVVVSDTGHVTREGDTPAAHATRAPQPLQRRHTAVGADGRPMTSAGSLQAGGAVLVGAGAELGEGGALGLSGAGDGAGREDECVGGRVLVLRFDSNWGDADAIGLCGLEVLLADRTALDVDASMLTVSVTVDGVDVSEQIGPEESEGGGYLAPSYAASLFTGDYERRVKQDMWLLPMVHVRQKLALYTLSIRLPSPRDIHSLRIWNYNSSLEGSYRGVKRLLVTLDGQRISPPVGNLVRKGPGPLGRPVAYAQTIRLLSASERVGTPYIFFGSSGGKAPPPVRGGQTNLLLEGGGAVLQEYEAPTLPSGFVFKFVFLSTWDDRFYMGLNGIEIYDQFDRRVNVRTHTHMHIHVTLGCVCV